MIEGNYKHKRTADEYRLVRHTDVNYMRYIKSLKNCAKNDFNIAPQFEKSMKMCKNAVRKAQPTGSVRPMKQKRTK